MKARNFSLMLILLGGWLLAACGNSDADNALSLATAVPTTPTAPVAASAPLEQTTAAATDKTTSNTSPCAQVLNRPAERAAIGFSAPDFEAKNIKSELVKLSESCGKPVVLNFWATWCPPCKEELPFLERLHQDNKDRFSIVGLDVGEDEALVKLKVREVGMTYLNLLDPKYKVANVYKVNVYPTTFFLDKDGVIRDVVKGALNLNRIEPYLDKILN